MPYPKSKAFVFTFLLSCLVIFLLTGSATARQHHRDHFPYNPIIFVHGGAGSGEQFQSQALRFTSNGYPQKYIYVHEYDSRFTIETMDDVWNRLDQLIADIKESLNVSQVDVLGHSLGTSVMQGYLASPERAKHVAHYVNIDGYPAMEPPGGVDTLALWAELSNQEFTQIIGAWNETIPNTTHTEVTTCAESFYYMYKFFTEKEPKTTKILPQLGKNIRISGRANYFPQNIGVDGGTLKIYKIDGYSGKRCGVKPIAVYSIDSDGHWGPLKVKAGEYYEFMLVHPTGELHPFYYESFIRDDHFIRLSSSPEPEGGLSAGMDRSDSHANLVVSRNKEFWGDRGIENDILAINGVNVINAEIFPSEPFFAIVSAMFLYDKFGDGESNLDEATEYSATTFFTGVDLHIPGAYPANDSIRVTLVPRGGNGLMQVLNIPNWASSEVRRVTIHFNDYLQADSIPRPKGIRSRMCHR